MEREETVKDEETLYSSLAEACKQGVSNAERTAGQAAEVQTFYGTKERGSRRVGIEFAADLSGLIYFAICVSGL